MAYHRNYADLVADLAKAFPQFEIETHMGEVQIDNYFIVIRIDRGYRVDCDTYAKRNALFTDTNHLIAGLRQYLQGRKPYHEREAAAAAKA